MSSPLSRVWVKKWRNGHDSELMAGFYIRQKANPYLFFVVRAMGGQVLFQDALAARLNVIKPSQADVMQYLQEREQSSAPRLTPGIQELVDKLHTKGKIVYLVSGGFRQVNYSIIFIILLAAAVLVCRMALTTAAVL